MPRKVDNRNALAKLWNLYVNEIDKMNYLVALTENGKSKCQSAGVRAFMYLYVNDKEVQNKVNAIIDDFIVIKEDGTKSVL